LLPTSHSTAILVNDVTAARGFALEEWESWHQYTTYFLEPVLALDAAALRLVESGIVVCAWTGRGKLVWRTAEGVKSTAAGLSALAGGTQVLSIRTDASVDPFVFECARQAAWFTASEEKVFNASSQPLAPCVRGFVGECRFESSGRMLTVYPMVKLDATGVMQVVLRMISPDRDVPLDEFLREYRGANSLRFDAVFAPAGLVKAVMRRDVFSPELVGRPSRRRRRHIEAGFRSLVDDHTQTFAGGDFSFSLAPLYRKDLAPRISETGTPVLARVESDEPGYMFREFAGTLVASTAHTLSGRANPLAAKRRRTLGEFWMGRPHIYVTRHQDQKKTAEENERSHGVAFGCLLAGVVCDTDRLALAFLPRSARLFQDFGWYVSRQATLMVWANTGLRQLSERADLNRGHLIYEQHAVAEALDRGYILHRRALQLALGARTTSEALRTQEDLIRHEQALEDATPYGELQDLLRLGWRAMGTKALRHLTDEAFEVRYRRNLLQEERRTGRWRWTIPTVLGFLASLGFSQQVLQPLWKWRAWPLPSDPHLADLVLVLATVVFFAGLLGILCFGLFLARRRS